MMKKILLVAVALLIGCTAANASENTSEKAEATKTVTLQISTPGLNNNTIYAVNGGPYIDLRGSARIEAEVGSRIAISVILSGADNIRATVTGSVNFSNSTTDGLLYWSFGYTVTDSNDQNITIVGEPF